MVREGVEGVGCLVWAELRGNEKYKQHNQTQAREMERKWTICDVNLVKLCKWKKEEIA